MSIRRFIQDVQLQGIATFFGQKGIYRKYATCPAMVEYESSNRSAHLATEFCSVDRVKEVSNEWVSQLLWLDEGCSPHVRVAVRPGASGT